MTWAPETRTKILERIASGESVSEICRSDGMPCLSTVFKWLSEDKDFSDKYTRAKESGLQIMADEILDIADNASNDWMSRNDGENVGWQFNGEHARRSHLRIESRKWLLSKLVPKKYGDRMHHSGDDENPVKHIHEIRRLIVKPDGDS